MSRIRVLTGLCAALSLAACSEFTASGDPLTDAEAGELAELLVGDGLPGLGNIFAARPQAAPAEGAAPAEKITININDSGPCEEGGTVAFAGSLTADFNEQAESGSLEYKFTITPTGCVVVTQSGKEFTLTGDPRIEVEGDFDIDQSGFDGSLKYKGKFQWVAEDGREGVCGVDLSAEFQLSLEGEEEFDGSASVKGKVCGVSVNRSVEFAS